MTDADTLTSALAGRYAVQRELGAGGMATVYLARDLQHDRLVALKAILPAIASVIGADRFRREIRLVAQLQHPHIVPVFDSGEAGGRLWFTMPYIEGESLRARLERERQLPLADAARIATQVAAALDEAHRRGILHRDVKPENILLTSTGDALLADFGVARPAARDTGSTLTADGFAVGTAAYMSPEQTSGDRLLDGRTDQYALACVVYEALTGEPPHLGPSPQSILVKRLTEATRPARLLRPAVPPAWDAALLRALALAPADRFETTGAFAGELTGGTSLPAAPAGKRSRVPVLIAAVIAVLAGAVWLALRKPSAAPTELTLEDAVQITSTGLVRAPAISADEKQLAYVTSACNGGHCSYAIELQDLGSTNPRRIFEGATAAYRLEWSPDRRYLILLGTIDGRFGSYLVPTSSGAPRRLTSGYATFYAGGDSLLLTSAPRPDSVFWVRVAALDGATRDSFKISGPGNGLGLVTAVPGSPWFVAVMFVPEGFSYLLVDRHGRERSRIGGGGLLNRVSGDALWLQSGFDGDPGMRITRLPLDRRSGRFTGTRSLAFAGAFTGFDVTADGGHLIVDRGSPEYDTWVTDLHSALQGGPPSGQPLSRVSAPNLVRLSPDGSRLLLDRVVGTTAGATEQLLVMPAGSGEGAALPLALRGDLISAFWIDSVTVAIGESSGDTVRLSVVDLRTGARRDEFMPNDSTLTDFDWLPPGGWVWVSGDKSLKVHRDGAAVRTIAMPSWYSSLARVRAAPDGKRLAWLGWNNTTWDTLRVATIPVDGGAETPLAAFSAENGDMTWLDDGSLLYKVREGTELLTLYHVRGPGQAERLGSLPWHIWGAELSRDLRRVAITLKDYRADAWMSRVVRP